MPWQSEPHGICSLGFQIAEPSWRSWSGKWREETPLGVLLADIDHFKQVNDQQGHQAGDAVLYEFAQRISGQMRSYSSVGRFGGEEFLIVLPHSDRKATAQIAERLRKCIADVPFEALGNNTTVSVSIGGTVFAKNNRCDQKTLIQQADKTLYRAKALGRNRTELSLFESNLLKQLQ